MDCRCLSVLLLAAFAVGQDTAPVAPSSPAQPPAAVQAGKAARKPAAEMSPSTPVITINGVCEKAPAPKTATAATSKAKPAGACKTVITKAEFESLANALQPNMNPATKRMLADRYPKMLVFADAAHKRGLDADPNFKKVLQFYRLQILTQELARSVKENAEKVPDAEIAKYYKDNTAEFEQAELQRLYVPKDKQVEAASADKPEVKSAEQQKADEDALKKEADSLRARAAAGEDLNKLQKEAYEAAGMKGTPPQATIGKLTRNELPVSHRPVLDLKAGEVSQVIAEPNGFYVYKVVSKQTKPLEAVKEEIRTKLAQQKFQDEMQSIESSAQAQLNDAYFGAPPGAPGMPGMPAGAMRPPAAGQPPAPPQVAPAQPATPSSPAANQNSNPESPKQ